MGKYRSLFSSVVLFLLCLPTISYSLPSSGFYDFTCPLNGQSVGSFRLVNLTSNRYEMYFTTSSVSKTVIVFPSTNFIVNLRGDSINHILKVSYGTDVAWNSYALTALSCVSESSSPNILLYCVGASCAMLFCLFLYKIFS
ncbi:MAG: hypothetical protein LLF28_02805 [Nitrospiraceae bacterium]|nr:hypothetical protein [Nitrospiraceae bacterium]